jgi:hypothetical protein
MSKRKAHQPKSLSARSSNRPGTILIAGLLFFLCVTGLVIAGWKSSHEAGRSNSMRPAAPVSMSPNGPSKEYIYAGGRLVSTEEAPPATAQAAENVVWTDVAGAVPPTSNNLTKNVADGWGNSGAVSTRALASGDGYFEFTVNTNTGYWMCGLTSHHTNHNYPDIDFGFYIPGGETIRIYEAGVQKYVSTVSVANGDHFKVTVEGGAIKYYRNGGLFYTSSVPPSYPLKADATLWSNGSTVSNAMLYGLLQ